MARLSTTSASNALSGGGEMGALLRAFDWSKTSLGPIDSWPQSLKTSVSTCLNSRFPILIWWGPEMVKIYNDAYVQLIKAKHPGAFGAPGREVWPEIWPTIGPMLEGVMERGDAPLANDLLLMLERNGYAEECYFTFSYSPIRDESGGVGGIFTPVHETTESVIGDRRLRTLRALSVSRNHSVLGTTEACLNAVRALAANPYDVPFAGIYLFDPTSKIATLTASTAGPDTLTNFPQQLDLSNDEWFADGRLLRGETCEFSAARVRRAPLSLESWSAMIEEIIAVPIVEEGEAAPVGIVVSVISATKRLDDAYRAFFSQIAEEIGEALRDAKTAELEIKLRDAADAEKEKIRALFMHAPAGILMLEGPEHRISLVNEGYLRLVDRVGQKDVVGQTLGGWLPELVVDQGFQNLLDGVYRTGIPYIGTEMPARVNRGDQLQDAYFNFVYQPTWGGDGTISGIMVYVFEVTDQVVARREVESREEQFRVLADSIPHLAWMADPDGDIFWYNQRWYEYTGTTLEEMSGWGWQSVHDPEMLPVVVERYKESLATGHAFSMNFPLRGSDGTFHTFLTLAIPVRDSTGKIVRWFGTNTDVESERKAETALRQSEKLAAVGRLASSIAHEINNPLEAVTNLIYLAKSAPGSEEARTFLESAEVELGRVAQITNQTLRFHKQQSRPAATDVRELFNSILTLYRGKLSHEGVVLQLEMAECAPLLCYAGEIRQVLANLVGNALDAMPHGGTLRLRVRGCTNWKSSTGDPKGSAIRITVADTGHGMTPTTMKRLYEPFFTTKEAFGTGLGLWVSAGIVEKHRGHFHVRSSTKSGKRGTVFTLIFPLSGGLEPAN